MSDSVRPHRWQPTRLLCPWDSPGKNTGVGCHFPLQCMKVKNESEVAQSFPTLSDPMDCSLPGSSIHGIFQARVLEWGATAFSLYVYTKVEKEKQNIFRCVITQSRGDSSVETQGTARKGKVENAGRASHGRSLHLCVVIRL